jgi:hypothetical protein
MLQILKRAAGFGEIDLLPEEEFASAIEAFPIAPEPAPAKSIVDRFAHATEDGIDICRAEKNELENKIAANEAAHADLCRRLADVEFVIGQLEPMHERLTNGPDFVEHGLAAPRSKRGKTAAAVE